MGDLRDIMAVTGQSSLFKYVSQGRNGIIVESLEDKKRTQVAASAKVSTLEDIAIFTDSEEVPLSELLKKMKEKEEGKEALSHLANIEELKKYFAELLPNYDRDRVYISDIKKVFKWYNLLIKNNLTDFEVSKEEVEGEEKPGIKTDDNKPHYVKPDVRSNVKGMRQDVKKSGMPTRVMSAAGKKSGGGKGE